MLEFYGTIINESFVHYQHIKKTTPRNLCRDLAVTTTPQEITFVAAVACDVFDWTLPKVRGPEN